MHAEDVVMYGDKTIMASLEGVPEDQREVGGVCGVWSVKDIMAHITSAEWLFVDVLKTFLDGGETPYLNSLFEAGPYVFNDAEVEKRSGNSYDEVISEYEAAREMVKQLLPQVPLEKQRETGSMPWYGAEYDLEDMVCYAVYANKREHAAQIDVFKDRLKSN